MMAWVCVIVAYIIILLIFKGRLNLKFTVIFTLILGGLMWGGYNGVKNAFGGNGNSYVSALRLKPGYEYLRTDNGKYLESISERIDVAEGQIGDSIVVLTQSQQFSFRVNSVELLKTYKGHSPEEGFTYLVANITASSITSWNTFFFSEGFCLRWGEVYKNKGYWIYDGETTFLHSLGEDVLFGDRDNHLDGVVEGGRGRTSVTFPAVFEIPILEGTNEYCLYYSFYPPPPSGSDTEDRLKNVYSVRFNLTTPES